METEIIEVKNESLEKVLADSKIEVAEQVQIRNSYLPYFKELNLIKEDAKKINFENPSPLDEKIARDLRLRTMKVRTGSESVKQERKRIYMLKADVEQAAWNLIKANCLHDEELFNQVEKKREIADNKRKQELKAERETKLKPFGVDTTFYDLANMPETAFENLFTSTKLSHDAAIEAAARIERERLEKEKADAAEREKQRLENIRLKEEAEKKDAAMKAERDKIEAERRAEQKKAADQLAEQQKKAAKLKADADAKAKKEKEAADYKLRVEKGKREAVEKELKEKEAIELKAEQERILAAKKAQAAPDKEKLLMLASNISDLILPKLNSPEADQILSSAKNLLDKVVVFIKEKTESL